MVSVSGTSANLKQGDELTILDLLYGVMLPSGNDAASAVAESVGRILLNSDLSVTSNQCVKAFLAEMNRVAVEYNLQSSNFCNPHGLANLDN